MAPSEQMLEVSSRGTRLATPLRNRSSKILRPKAGLGSQCCWRWRSASPAEAGFGSRDHDERCRPREPRSRSGVSAWKRRAPALSCPTTRPSMIRVSTPLLRSSPGLERESRCEGHDYPEIARRCWLQIRC